MNAHPLHRFFLTVKKKNPQPSIAFSFSMLYCKPVFKILCFDLKKSNFMRNVFLTFLVNGIIEIQPEIVTPDPSVDSHCWGLAIKSSFKN